MTERSYSTKILRPKPIFHIDEEGSFIVVVTTWGLPEHGQRAIEEVVKYVNSARSDVEVTSPFEFLTCLSDEVNCLRTGMLIANDFLFRGENRKEYFSGIEICALLQKDNQIAWAQVGGPSLLLQRSGLSLQPISVSQDLASELASEGLLLAPLPSQLLGVDASCNIHCGDLRVSPGDELILVSNHQLPSVLWLDGLEKKDFVSYTKQIIEGSPETPFWLGLIDVD